MRPSSRKPMRLRFPLAAALCAALVACGDAPAPPTRPTVVVSVLPLAYVVDRLSGGLVETVVMLPPGASPSQYQPTVRQLGAVAEAVLYVKVGHPAFPFEAAWLDRLLEGKEGLRVATGPASTGAAAGDPHVWLSPTWMVGVADAVTEALAAELPDHAAALRANRDRFRSEVTALERTIRARLGTSAARTFLVHHPAWGHFAAAFGLTQIAVEHHRREPDPHALAERIAWAREHGVRVIFVQPQFDPAPARTVAREIDARVVVLDPLAYDWAANLLEMADAIREGLVR